MGASLTSILSPVGTLDSILRYRHPRPWHSSSRDVCTRSDDFPPSRYGLDFPDELPELQSVPHEAGELFK